MTNGGPSPATGVIVTDTLPAGAAFVTARTTQGTVSESGGVVTATLGDLGLGAMATVTIIVRAHRRRNTLECRKRRGPAA